MNEFERLSESERLQLRRAAFLAGPHTLQSFLLDLVSLGWAPSGVLFQDGRGEVLHILEDLNLTQYWGRQEGSYTPAYLFRPGPRADELNRLAHMERDRFVDWITRAD